VERCGADEALCGVRGVCDQLIGAMGKKLIDAGVRDFAEGELPGKELTHEKSF
jgi:hypothetical protein